MSINELIEKYGDNLEDSKKDMTMEELMYLTIYRRNDYEKKKKIKESIKRSSKVKR